jgi:membrane associated rhomboid family serine protease
MYFFYFYPLGLDRKLRRRPVLSWTLAASMIVTFLWMRYRPDLGPVSPYDLVYYPGSSGALTAVTAVFMHGGWFHLLGNLLYFLVFGPPLEDRLGRWKFLMYFLLLGAAGNLVHGVVTAWGLLGEPGMGVLGASGAIAGLLSFAVVRFYSARVEVAWWVLAPLGGHNKAGRSKVPLMGAVFFWLLLQVVQALVAPETGANVSFGAHFGGFGMGLVLALFMGEGSAGRAEAARARANEYFQAGHFHAATGAWIEYLEMVPGDREGLLELARALRVSGQEDQAREEFRCAFDGYLKEGRISEALAVHDEARRGAGQAWLPAEELAKVAYYKEKQLDYAGALAAYRDLYLAYPGHPQGQRALVRVIVLYHGKVADETAAREWLDEAWLRLPQGSWRDFLEREFNLGSRPHEGAATGRGSPGRAPGS